MPAPERPNVLVFFTDQQRWDVSGLHGCPLDLMPNFDYLAQRGTFLANSFTCQPVCGPARACLQTGRYATQLGCYRNGIALPAQARTLAHHFRTAGYRTGYIGKWHLATEEPVTAPNRGGYESWLASNTLEFTSNAYQTVMCDEENRPVFLPGYRVDAMADATIRFVHAHREEPFFLFTSYIEPHFQNHLDDYPPPFGYRERYASRWLPPDLLALPGSQHQHWAGYCGMVKRLDEALGRLMDALISLRLDQRTIILFTTDHGCHFKTRNSEYKRSCHESCIRLPTMLHGGPFTGGGRLDQLTSLIDLPPTLLDGAGLPVPGDMMGRSVLPLTRGQTAGWQDDVFLEISEAQVGRALRTSRWKYSVIAPDKKGGQDMRGGTYREDCLYDLAADPYELRNLVESAAHAPVRDELRRRLLARLASVGETAEITTSPTKPSGQRRVALDEALDPSPWRAFTQLPRG